MEPRKNISEIFICIHKSNRLTKDNSCIKQFKFKNNFMETIMKNTNKLILGALLILLSSGIAFANAPVATDAAGDAAAKSADVAKDAAADVANTAKDAVTDAATTVKDKAVGVAKEKAGEAVDAATSKMTDAMDPAKKAAEAAAKK